MHGAGDKRHLCSQCNRCFGQGIALFAGRPVGNVAHRIDGLVRRPGGDDDLAARERAVRQTRLVAAIKALDGGKDVCRFAHPPGPELAAGHVALFGPREQHAILLQRGDVSLGRTVLPHAHVHGRRDQHRLVGGHQRSRGKIIGKTCRHLGHQVGGGRRHNDEVRNPRQLNVSHLGFIRQVEQVGIDLLARQSRY